MLTLQNAAPLIIVAIVASDHLEILEFIDIYPEKCDRGRQSAQRLSEHLQ
jgi:hypothetical protein